MYFFKSKAKRLKKKNKTRLTFLKATIRIILVTKTPTANRIEKTANITKAFLTKNPKIIPKNTLKNEKKNLPCLFPT